MSEEVMEVTLTVGNLQSRNIGWIEDLAFLPDLLDSVADELRCMMIAQHNRQQLEKMVQGLQDE